MHKEKLFKKVVLLVVDGFGVGEMDDVIDIRPLDIGSNTALNVIKDLEYKTFEKLGLYDLLNLKKTSNNFIIGTSNLMHFGADSFFGHQEIMGTEPKRAEINTFSFYFNDIVNLLEKLSIKYTIINEGSKLIVVNDCFTIADNIETDKGQAFNITADLNVMSFDDVVYIAKKIRSIIKVPRLIVFGSKDTSLKRILSCIEIPEIGVIGVNAPQSGVYTDTYQCVHLGYGIDESKQCSSKLIQLGYDVSLIGKTADVIKANGAELFAEVDTLKIMKKTIEQEKVQDNGLIFVNVQETDLAGHEENLEKFQQKLKIVDEYLSKLINQLDDNTLLIVMADHGDDPCIGHAFHTREKVPIMFYHNNITEQKFLDNRDTMADVGQSVFNLITKKKLDYGKIIEF